MKFREISVIIAIISLFIALIGCTSTEVVDGWVSTEYSQEEADQLQTQVDEGHMPGALEWRQVAREFLSLNDMKVDESVDSELISDEKSKVIAQYTLTDGRAIQLELVQPSKEGTSGIYMVSQYRFVVEE